MTEPEIRAWVQQWWDRVWGEADHALIDDMVTEGYLRHSASGTITGGRAKFKEDMAQYARILHHPVTTVDDLDVVGAKAWFRATSRGANLETGESTVVTWVGVYRFGGGKLAESWALTVSGVAWA